MVGLGHNKRAADNAGTHNRYVRDTVQSVSSSPLGSQDILQAWPA